MLNGARTKSNRGRKPRDLYITTPELAEAAIERFYEDEVLMDDVIITDILDPGCGTGVWGKPAALKFVYAFGDVNEYPYVVGIDIVPGVVPDKTLDFKTGYNEVIQGDYLEYKGRFDLICGNPPYSLAEEFIRHSFELLEPDGYIYFLLRLSFLEGMKRERGLFKEFPMKRVYVCSRRPSFYSSDGKRHTTDTLAYAMFLWQKGYTGETQLEYLNWEYKK